MVELKKNKGEFHGTLYMRPSEETPIDMIWMNLTINNCKPEDFINVFKNGPPFKLATERRKVRDFDENSSLLYIKIKLPMIDAREQVIKRTVKKLDDGSYMHLLQSVLDDEFPITDGIVRAQFYKCQIVKPSDENPNDTDVTDISSMDLKGHFPPRMINMIASQALSKGFPEIIKVMREEQK